MYKNNFKNAQLDIYQAPQVSVIALQTEQTILNVSPGGFDFGFGGFGDGEFLIG